MLPVVTPPPPIGVHSVETIRADHGFRTTQSVYNAILDGRISAIRHDGRWFVTDTERRRLLRDGWPSKNPAVTRFWNDWREYRRQHEAVGRTVA